MSSRRGNPTPKARRRPKRPRRWITLDIEFLRRPRVVALREEFGPAGPVVMLALILEVDRTEYGRATDSVEGNYAELGALSSVSASKARAVIEAARSLGLVAIERERDVVTGRETERLRLLKRANWAPRSSAPESNQTRRTPTDEKVIGVLSAADGPLRGQEIADALNLAHGGSFRTRLSRLVQEGRILRDRDGYVVAMNR